MRDRNTEKKIAEIREAAKKPYWNVFDDARSIANAPEWLGFLLSELERKDEVIEEQKRELFYKSKEITELREKSWQDQQWFKQASANITEMQKLREERDKWEKEARLQYRLSNEMIEDIRTCREQLQSAQQGIERLGNLARELEAAKKGAEG